MGKLDKVASAFAEYVARLVERGGPSEDEYAELTRQVHIFDEARRAGKVSHGGRHTVARAFGDTFSLDTMQGMVVRKPHGYAGDYETIDRIYTHWMSPKPELANWDRYFHAQAAPKAVRNRKAYLHTLLDQLPQGASVLNVGSGPARCVSEWLKANPDADVSIDCLDKDSKALAYAQSLCNGQRDRVDFRETDVLRYRPDRHYDLVWSSGLFDYFNDRVFHHVAKRLVEAVAPSGSLVIGNFAVGNPTRAYMELGDWYLHHRTPAELTDLLERSGAEPGTIQVRSESEGVNLFAHVFRP